LKLKLSRLLEILVQTEIFLCTWCPKRRGEFLTIEEFQNKFKIKIKILHYLQLIAAIPWDIKKKAATIEVPMQELLSTVKLFSSVIPTLDLTEMHRKSYLKMLNGIHRWPKLDIWAALYMLTFALLRDSSDLHIYKDFYGENNDCFCNLWKCSDLNKNRLTLLELRVFSSCVVFEPIYGHFS